MAGAPDQLDAETRWLRGKMPRSILAPRKNWRPSKEMTRTAEKALEILQHRELSKPLAVLEKFNSDSERKGPFLLGPYLFRVIRSVEQRQAIRAKHPLLGAPPAEVRDHFRQTSTDAKALANLLRKGPQPRVALAARHYARDAFEPLPMVQSPGKAKIIVPLNELLHRVAASLDIAAQKITRAKLHNRLAKKKESKARQYELRLLTASILVEAFRRELKHPHHNHVATITTVLSGISTDADYVKKVEKRREA
jgi:hypothetical protein